MGIELVQAICSNEVSTIFFLTDLGIDTSNSCGSNDTSDGDTHSYFQGCDMITELRRRPCSAAGARSGLACEFSASFSIDENRLFNIFEGMPTWISKGLPVEKGI